MRSFLFSTLCILIAPMTLMAQPLVDRLPDDAEIYVGWSGTNAPGTGYDQSHLKAVLEASQLREFIQESIPKFFQRVGAQDPMGARKLRQLSELLTAMAQHPTAIYFGGLTSAEAGGPPLPKLAIVCDGGEDSAKIEQQVGAFLSDSHGPRLNVRRIDTLVEVSDFVMPEKIDRPLSQSPDFQAAMGQVGTDPSIAMFINGTELVATIDALIAQAAPPQAKQMWPQIRDALGIDGLKAIASTAGFDGKNWMVQGFVNAPAPRHGLLAMADAPPLSDDLLKTIPDTATIAGAGTLDLNGLFTQIDQAVVQLSPDHGDQFHQIISQMNQTLGFDLQKDFLAAFGAQWGYFCDPTVAGDGPLGFTIVNRPKNAQQLQTSLSQIETLVNSIVQQQFQNQGQKMTIAFRQSTIDGTVVHFLAVPLISPCWAIKDGTLYLGLYPQVLDGAYSRPADAKSIKDNAAYQATMQLLQAPAQVTGFSFVDLPKTLPGSYQTCIALSRLYFGLGDLVGMQSPPMVIPPLPKLMNEVEPSGGISWTDEVGYHFKGVEPFPGAAALGSAGNQASAGLGESALITSIMLPSLNRARETANRVKCASNLRQIGQGIQLYENDHLGALPPDLGTLFKTEPMLVTFFCCPDTNTTPPAGMTPDVAADWVNKNSDYVYIGANMKAGKNATSVVCYDKDGNHGGDGINMLFGDGHIEFVRMEMAKTLIRDSMAQR